MPWYQAPAKINLGLRVGPRDATGYHPVDTVMQTVSLSDQLYIEPRDHMLWEASPNSPALDEDNLVVRAYAWCVDMGASLPPIYGRLDKYIPVGAGLGGGSSDAAALIRWAFHNSDRLSTPDFMRETAALGKDVPFFIRGGAARAEAYGERLTPLPTMTSSGVVLANPGISLSTAAVYQAFDSVCMRDTLASLDGVHHALVEGHRVGPEDLVNDLEEAAFLVMPALKDFRGLLRGTADGAVCALSGSGPTYYIVGEDEDWAEWMAARLRNRGVPWVQPTSVLDSW